MRYASLIGLILVFVFSAPVAAGPLDLPPKESDRQSENSSQDIPDWVKRTSVALDAQSDKKPKYFLETVQPLLGTGPGDERVLFTHLRLSTRDNRGIYNLGFGVRKLFEEELLLGVNAFYDYQEMHRHSRGGLGFEAFTDRGLEARVNTYLRISNERLVREDANNKYYEKVANGLDAEIGAPLPYLPFLKVFGGGYWYDFEDFKNKCGWQTRVEYNPVDNSRLVFQVFDDTKRNSLGYRVEGAITLAFTSFAPRDVLNDLKFSNEAMPKIDLTDKMLERVVRDFDITVISTTRSNTGLTIEGGRSG